MKTQVSCSDAHAFVMMVRGSRENGAQRGSLRKVQLYSSGSGRVSMSRHVSSCYWKRDGKRMLTGDSELY